MPWLHGRILQIALEDFFQEEGPANREIGVPRGANKRVL